MFAQIRISNSVHKSFLSVKMFWPVISALKHTLKSTLDTCKVVLLPVNAVLKLDTLVPLTVALAVWIAGPPEGPHLNNWGPHGCGQSLVQVQCGWAVEDHRSQVASPGFTLPLEVGSSLGVWCLILWSLQGGEKLSNEDVKALLCSEILSAVPSMS